MELPCVPAMKLCIVEVIRTLFANASSIGPHGEAMHAASERLKQIPGSLVTAQPHGTHKLAC